MNKLASALHDATHLVPGVPDHSEAPATQERDRTRVSPRLQNPKRHDHQNPPRVLVTWQNWIGGLVGHNSHE